MLHAGGGGPRAIRVLKYTMDSHSQATPKPSWTWRSEPGCSVSLVLLGVVLISLAAGSAAKLVVLGRWASGICGDWAPPGWKNDPRCDGSLLRWSDVGYLTAKWSAGALCLAIVWLLVRLVRRIPPGSVRAA